MVLAMLAKASPQTWRTARAAFIHEATDEAAATWDDCYVQHVLRRGFLSGDMRSGSDVIGCKRRFALEPRDSALPTNGSLARELEAQVRGVGRPALSALSNLARGPVGATKCPCHGRSCRGQRTPNRGHRRLFEASVGSPWRVAPVRQEGAAATRTKC